MATIVSTIAVAALSGHMMSPQKKPLESAAKVDGLVCSFCGKHQKEVRKLIAGPSVYICDECVGLCAEILMEEGDQWRNQFCQDKS